MSEMNTSGPEFDPEMKAYLAELGQELEVNSIEEEVYRDFFADTRRLYDRYADGIYDLDPRVLFQINGWLAEDLAAAARRAGAEQVEQLLNRSDSPCNRIWPDSFWLMSGLKTALPLEDGPLLQVRSVNPRATGTDAMRFTALTLPNLEHCGRRFHQGAKLPLDELHRWQVDGKNLYEAGERTLSMLERLYTDPLGRAVISPQREAASQVGNVHATLASYKPDIDELRWRNL